MVSEVDLSSPKALQIIKGAKEAFLELGYEGASTDEITRRAGVSKGTVYNYFADKKALFQTVIERECAEQARRITQSSEEADTVEDALRVIALRYVELMTSDFLVGIFRVVVSEAERFPDLAKVFYDSGPELAQRRLSEVLAAADARGELKINDIELAALQFAGLCRAEPFFKRIFGVKRSFRKADISRIANSAVDAFLNIYRPK